VIPIHPAPPLAISLTPPLDHFPTVGVRSVRLPDRVFAYDSSLARHVWCSAWRTADAVCSPPRWLAGWLAAKLMHGERLAQPQTSLAGPSIFKFAPGASVDLAHAIDFHR
jgi:hypothetical protein